jgi:hypothetical protein
VNNLDGGTGSLRDPIKSANSGDTIVFASSLNGQAITLTSGELAINKSLPVAFGSSHVRYTMRCSIIAHHLSDWAMAVAVLALAIMGLTGNAKAGVVINIDQVGPNVVTTGSGAFDLADFGIPGNTNSQAIMVPSGPEPWMIVGSPTQINADIYIPVTGPANFGGGENSAPTTGVGDTFGLEAGEALIVPHGYVSGTALNATDTYAGQTFSSLGLTPGTYTWTWGTGAHADSLTVNVGTASVPEPSSLVLSGIAVAGVMAYMWRRRTGDQQEPGHRGARCQQICSQRQQRQPGF